ncbi:hypothetical protein BgiBS90_028168 [Biomphalaria glabrata]|nr:hypothetical protein BgiBS90_028168 [Biomphalaria glabrata]
MNYYRQQHVPIFFFSCLGDHEKQVYDGNEANLKSHYADCQKNPGHLGFIPISTFSISDLPVGHRDNDLYELIKVTADLTVRINVTKVSHSRPEFWPNTDKPYPFRNQIGSTTARSGSGIVGVVKYIDGFEHDISRNIYNVLGHKPDTEYKTCPCDKCQNSDRPSNVWWEVFVHTATHVVFDEIEASHTSVRLFFDEDDSPLVTMDKLKVDYINIERDRCQLKYITCDATLGNRLCTMDEHWFALRDKVLNSYTHRQENKLNFIVSHPHGCPKYVCIGQWTDNAQVAEFNDDYDFTQLTYTTGTCPGSSGAMVHCVGFKGGHFHSGTLTSELNYSCVGRFWKTSAAI